MATSGTTSFDLNIDEIIDEGYERCGLSTNAGYDLRSARRSLNLLFQQYKSKNFIIIKEFGLLKPGMCCYCFYEDQHFIRLWFQTPVIWDTCEVKISKADAHILKER